MRCVSCPGEHVGSVAVAELLGGQPIFPERAKGTEAFSLCLLT